MIPTAVPVRKWSLQRLSLQAGWREAAWNAERSHGVGGGRCCASVEGGQWLRASMVSYAGDTASEGILPVEAGRAGYTLPSASCPQTLFMWV